LAVTSPPTAPELAARVVAGVPAAVARAITWVETGGRRAEELLEALPPRTAQVIGITGSPGAGKSTLVNALVSALRSRGVSVAIVAVDPSSPLTGGALLGDRVRLEGVTGDAGVFFRSLASRGASGGVSEATRAATHVLSAAGFDVVLVETVGAGQSEVEVMRMADSVVVVLIPGAGDEMQAMKAGLMEIADVFALNKADLPGAAELKAHVVAALRSRDRSDGWYPRMVATTAHRHQGIDELIEALDKHRVHLAGGDGAAREVAGTRAEVLRRVKAEFARAALRHLDDVLAEARAEGFGEPEAARRLLTRTAGDLHQAGSGDTDDVGGKR
jgi:LAO/AO transport system kinase